MKIGPLDLSVRAVVYAGIIFVGLMALGRFWSANADTRMESIYRDAILRGTFDDDSEAYESAVKACRGILASQPQKLNVRLFLGTLLLRDRTKTEGLKEAVRLFSEAAKSGQATPEEKSWALVGAGVAEYYAGGGADLGASEKFFTDALAANSKCGDAVVNLGLLEMLKGGPGAAERAERRLKEVPAAALSPRAEVQRFQLQGLLASLRGRTADALTEYSRARALRPDLDEVARNQRLALLAATLAPETDAKGRREYLARIGREFSTFGSDQLLALNVEGRGWTMLNADDKAWFTNAHNFFTQAQQRDPSNVSAYLNRAALLETRLGSLVKTLSVTVTGLNGVAAPPNPGETAKPLPAGDGRALNDIRTLLRELETVWKTYAEHVSDLAKKDDAHVRELACLRRLVFAAGDDNARKQAAEQALALARELAKADEKNGEVQFALGEVLLERGDLLEARKAFQAARALKFGAPTLETISTALESPPALVRVRPTGNQRWYGSVPLVQVTFKAATLSSAFKEVSMQLDGKPVKPILSGTQVFFAAPNASALDNSHALELSVTDALGNVLNPPKIVFGLDRKPPTLKVTPETTVLLTKDPKWTIAFADESGVDVSTINVTLKSQKAMLAMTRSLIKNGHYQVSVLDATPPIKPGTPTGESFTVCAGSELQPGEYALIFSAQDMEGNTLNETRTYTVR